MNDVFVLFHQIAKPETAGPSASIYVLWRVSVPRSYISLRFNSPQARTERGEGGAVPCPPNPNLKNSDFLDMAILRDLPFGRNQPLKSMTSTYNAVLKKTKS